MSSPRAGAPSRCAPFSSGAVVERLRPAGRRPQVVHDYLLVPLELLGLFGVVELPLLLLPLAPLLGLLGEELLPDAEDGLFDVLLEPPAADWSR